MEANKRDWNSVVKSSKLAQVRSESVLSEYHIRSAASLLTAERITVPLLVEIAFRVENGGESRKSVAVNPWSRG